MGNGSILLIFHNFLTSFFGGHGYQKQVTGFERRARVQITPSRYQFHDFFPTFRHALKRRSPSLLTHFS